MLMSFIFVGGAALLLVCAASAFRLIRATAAGASNVVDMYNIATGAWFTDQLSEHRSCLAATSVGNVAIFAGGWNAGVMLSTEGGLWK